jgi:hypothetical protein
MVSEADENDNEIPSQICGKGGIWAEHILVNPEVKEPCHQLDNT